MTLLRFIPAAICAVAFGWASPAGAQCFGQLAAGQICGNSSASQALPVPNTVGPFIDRSISSTRGAILERGAAGWAAITPGSVGLPFVSGGAGADGSYAILGVLGGGTGLATGTSGGILYFNGSTSLASSGALTLNGLVIGGGAGGSPTSLTGTSGGIPYFNTAGTVASSGALLANAPVIGGGAGVSPSVGTRSGNTTTFATTTGALTNAHIATFDASGNIVDGGALATGTVTAGGGGIVPTSGSPATLFQEQMPVGGRLTLINGTCVATTDQVAATVLYYAPCGGGKYVPVYDGTNMRLWPFTASDSDTTGITYTLGTNTAASTLHDVVILNNAGTLVMCVAAWSNSGLGTSSRGFSLQLLKGVWVNAAALGCRLNNTTTTTCAQFQCTYVGTFKSAGSVGQIDLKFGTNAVNGGTACVCIWNLYNQVQASVAVGDTTVTWTYSTNAFRAANGQATNRIDYVQGLPGQPIDVFVINYSNNNNASIQQASGIGIDSQSSNSANIAVANVGGASVNLPSFAYLNGTNAYLAAGFHSIYRLEFSGATATTTWIGAVAANQIQTGIRGNLWY